MMGWFKVHSDDLHKIEKLDLRAEEKPIEPISIKTKDVVVYVARYSDRLFPMALRDKKYINGEVMTRTNLRDAFVKAAMKIAEHPDFDPKFGYEISGDVKVVAEPVLNDGSEI